jgi:lysine 2,3-aminomutase
MKSGYAMLQYVIDAPGGGGKVPINPGYILYHDNEKIVIRNYEGKIFEYPATGNENRPVRSSARLPRRILVLIIAHCHSRPGRRVSR